MSDKDKTVEAFRSLVEIVQRLRGPDGCPWDKEQTQSSLTQYAIEEAYELVEAIESKNQDSIKEELGDFLFQVILQAQVAQDEKSFDLHDVINALNEKMVSRHPHVFSNVKVKDIEEIWKNWESIKAEEKEKKSEKKKGVFTFPQTIPALQASLKIGVKTEGYKFDWDNPQQVVEKVKEELKEVEVELKNKNQEKLSKEIGDLLFSVAQLARHTGLDPEQCLRIANRRFQDRFETVLEEHGGDKESFRQLSTEKMEALWKNAKKKYP